MAARRREDFGACVRQHLDGLVAAAAAAAAGSAADGGSGRAAGGAAGDARNGDARNGDGAPPTTALTDARLRALGTVGAAGLVERALGSGSAEI